MAIIAQSRESSQRSTKILSGFFQEMKINRLLHQCNIRKSAGTPASVLFQYLFGLLFLHQTHYEAMQSENKPFGKDSVYRFLNEGKYNWEKFLLKLALAATNLVRSWSASSQNAPALVVDDTLFKRHTSKAVELLSWVRDHNEGRSFRGFSMLTVVWTDGLSTIPCLFRLVASRSPSNLIVPARTDLDQRTLAARRRKEAQKPKSELLLDMLRRIAESGIIADYVLMDSWFFMPAVIARIKEIGFDVLVRVKYRDREFFRSRNRLWTLRQLRQSVTDQKRPSICSVRTELRSAGGFLPILLIFIPHDRIQGEWITLATTDLSLSAEDVIRIYGKRWSIETMFKICKDMLGLQSDFQTRSYDSMVASASIVLARYTCLALEHRSATDYRTWGELLRLCMEEIHEMGFSEAIALLFASISESLARTFHCDPLLIQEALSPLWLSLASFTLSIFPFLASPYLGCES